MIALQTRSFSKDYTFFGTDKNIPTRHWWSLDEEFSSFFMEGTEDTDFVIVMQIINQKWSVFLGGIPSERTDNKGRLIRYNFAGEGQCGDSSAEFFYDMFCVLLENYENLAQNMSSLSKLLDNEFSDAFINGLDGHRDTEDTERLIEQKLAIIKDKIHTQDNKYGVFLPEITMADILTKETAINFLKSAGILLTNAYDNTLCLVLTPLPLGKNNVLTCMQKFWMKDSNAKGIFLSYFKVPLSLPFKVESPSVLKVERGKKRRRILLIVVVLLLICVIGVMVSV